MEKKKEVSAKSELTKNIVFWAVFGVFAVGTVLAFVFANQIWGPLTVFAPELAAAINVPPFIAYLWNPGIPNLIRSVQIIVIAIALWYLLKLVAKITIHSKKGITIARLLINFARWVIAIAAIFCILAAWGADTTFMLASAGVVTLIIGLGSQALVADILAGVFIVFEGDFQVGDIVIIDGWRGEVQSIGIRTTRLVDAGGNVKIVTNNEIKSIINQTKELSVAKCYVGISYNDRIETVEKVIADNIDSLKEKIPDIVEGPFYKGVSELGESSVNLLFVAKCKESDIYQVQRDLNRQIKIMFDDNGIGIPFPQVTVSYEKDQEMEKISKKVKTQATEFVEEQKELSKDIDIKK